jgi:hypothetical protein
MLIETNYAPTQEASQISVEGFAQRFLDIGVQCEVDGKYIFFPPVNSSIWFVFKNGMVVSAAFTDGPIKFSSWAAFKMSCSKKYKDELAEKVREVFFAAGFRRIQQQMVGGKIVTSFCE